MRALTLFVALTLAIPAFAVEQTPARQQQDKTWMEVTCRAHNKRACLMAYGWHYLRQAEVVIDPALQTMAASGGVYGVAILIKYLGGDTAGTQMVLMAARTGLKAGAIVVVGGIVFTVAATLAMSMGFLLESTSATAAREKDEIAPECHAILKTVNDLGDISKLTAEQMQLLITCLPKESALSNVLAGVGARAMELERAGNSSALK